MTQALDQKAERSRRIKKTVFAATLGAISGFLGAMAFLRLADGGALGELGASQIIAALVGLIYLLMAGGIAVGLAIPKAGASYLNVEDADEMREQRTNLGLGTLSSACIGIAIIVAALAAPVGPIPPSTVLIVFFASIAVATVAGIVSARYQDELIRAVSREGAAISFYLVFVVGAVWSVLAHLGFAAGPQALDWLTLLWGLGLLGTFIAVGKRGMFVMR